jgi:hypothetical protein
LGAGCSLRQSDRRALPGVAFAPFATKGDSTGAPGSERRARDVRAPLGSRERVACIALG